MKKLLSLSLLVLFIFMVAQPAAAEVNAHHWWSIYSGSWSVMNEQLYVEAYWEESWIWAGSQPISTRGDFQAQLMIELNNNWWWDEVGRHGGIMFFASTPTNRNDGAISGYTIDWIDRSEDHGFRLSRIDNGVQTLLARGGVTLSDPPRMWRLVVEGDTISFYGDGQLIFSIDDGTYRQGHFGLWAYGNGTGILVDDVQVGNSFHDSFNGPLTPP